MMHGQTSLLVCAVEMWAWRRRFHLVDADSYTRAWYPHHLGKELPAPQGYPDDPVDQYRATFGLTRGPKGEEGGSGAAGDGVGVC